MSRKLTMEELNYVQEEVKLKGKSLLTAYIFALLLGGFGLHSAYLEKKKQAVTKFLMMVATIALYFPVDAAVKTKEFAGLTTQLQQYSSTLFVAYIILISANVIWLVADIVRLPSFVKKFNKKIEDEMSTKVIQASYVEGKIREDEASDRIVENVLEILSTEIQDRTKVIDEQISNIQKDLMKKNEKTNDLIENITSKLNQLEHLSLELENNVNAIKKAEIVKSKIEEQEKSTDLNSQDTIKEKSEAVKVEKIDSDKKDDSKELPSKNEAIEKFKSNLENTFKTNNNNSEEKVAQESDNISNENSENNEKNSDGTIEVNKNDLEKAEQINFEEIKSEESCEIEKNDSEETIDNTETNEHEMLDSQEITEEVIVDENFITVEEALEKGKGNFAIKGFIVGYMSPNKHDIIFDNFDGDMNVVVADNKDETDIEKMLIVQLTWDSKLRNNVGLLSKPENLYKEIISNGEIVKYFKGLGLKKITSIKFTEDGKTFVAKD